MEHGLTILYALFIAYGFIGWTFFLAYRFGHPGVIPAQFIVAIYIFVSDYIWVIISLNDPSSNGFKYDGFFVFGVLIRIILINTLLLPFACLAFHAWKKRVTDKNVENNPAE